MRRLAPSLLAALLSTACLEPLEPACESSPDGLLADDTAYVAKSFAGAEPAVDLAAVGELCSQRLAGLGVGVVYRGELVYAKGFGFQDLEAGIPVRAEETRFRWASISKTLTAVVAMQATLEGRLDLDADVRSYASGLVVPDTLPGSGITMRMLLGHLAGVFHYDNSPWGAFAVPLEAEKRMNPGFVWALAKWQLAPLLSTPGEKYSYSTFGFNLAGALVERAARAPYVRLVRDGISDPAGLGTLEQDSYYHSPWNETPDRAEGYDLDRRGEIVAGSDADVAWKLPGGGFHSSVADMARYCAALAKGEDLLPRAALEELWVSQRDGSGNATGYGMGFGVGSRGGNRRIRHGGSQDKARTDLSLYPDEGLCVVVMSNSTYAEPGRVSAAVEDAVRAAMEPRAAHDPLLPEEDSAFEDVTVLD